MTHVVTGSNPKVAKAAEASGTCWKSLYPPIPAVKKFGVGEGTRYFAKTSSLTKVRKVADREAVCLARDRSSNQLARATCSRRIKKPGW
jgi:hypothetical protein